MSEMMTHTQVQLAIRDWWEHESSFADYAQAYLKFCLVSEIQSQLELPVGTSIGFKREAEVHRACQIWWDRLRGILRETWQAAYVDCTRRCRELTTRHN